MRAQPKQKTPAWQVAFLVVGIVAVIAIFYVRARQLGWLGLSPVPYQAKKVEVRKQTASAKTAPASEPGPVAAPARAEEGSSGQEATDVGRELAGLRLPDRDPTARWYLTAKEQAKLGGLVPLPPPPMGVHVSPAPPAPLAEFPKPQQAGGAPPAPLLVPPGSAVPVSVRPDPEALRLAYTDAVPERVQPVAPGRRLMGTVSSGDEGGIAVVRRGGNRASSEYLSPGAEIGGRASVRAISPGRMEVAGPFRRTVVETRGVTRGERSGGE